MSAEYRTTSRWVVRLCIGGLFVVVCSLSGFAILTESRVAGEAVRTEKAARLSDVYSDARYWVGQEESLERKYRLEPSSEVLQLHDVAEASLVADLQEVAAIDRSAASRRAIARLMRQHAGYVRASDAMLQAVGKGDKLVSRRDTNLVDPVFGAIQSTIGARSRLASETASRGSQGLREDSTSATTAMMIAFALGLLLVAIFSLILQRVRRRADDARRAEVQRLAGAAMTDSLTGLRNLRAFHEDMARDLRRVATSASPLALIVIDVNDLKAVNDTRGHQVGDDHLTALAGELTRLIPAGASVYRTGGDEFAAVLPGERVWAALELTQRVHTALSEHAGPEKLAVTAGISEATAFKAVDSVLHEADLALIATKRRGQSAAIYTPEMEAVAAADVDLAAEHTNSLADALSRAVDAKDSYTRSHCQTVSQLCALLATELDLGSERIGRMRLAGLLHDVGKIGVPDAILTKPAKLTPEEYEVMKRHSVLGQEIVAAAGLPLHADWIRHHHERYDGNGYPDGLVGAEIPLESRIILAADAFEAMTSDRPYRKAPGRDFAIAELRRHAGTQFDSCVVDALCRALETPDSTPAAVPVSGSRPRVALPLPSAA